MLGCGGSFASGHDAASYAATTPALNGLLESLAEFRAAREEPDIFAAIGLGHKGAQGGAFSQEARDVADDCEALPILHEFLDQLAGDARAQLEKFVVEAFNRNNNQRGAILECLADKVDSVVVGSPLRPVGYQFEDAP